MSRPLTRGDVARRTRRDWMIRVVAIVIALAFLGTLLASLFRA